MSYKLLIKGGGLDKFKEIVEEFVSENQEQLILD